MTPEQAKAWLPLIQAVADGKTLQVNVGTYKNEKWQDTESLNFDCNVQAHRIKPEVKKQSYRVGLFKNMIGNFVPCVLCEESAEQSFERSSGFIRWLTDRTEYELPEGV